MDGHNASWATGRESAVTTVGWRVLCRVGRSVGRGGGGTVGWRKGEGMGVGCGKGAGSVGGRMRSWVGNEQ